MGPFRAVNKIQFYLLSLIWLRQYWLLPTADLYPKAEMGPRAGWNSLLIELFWPKLCSNCSRRSWIRLWPAGNWHFRTEADLFNFQCTGCKQNSGFPIGKSGLTANKTESLLIDSRTKWPWERTNMCLTPCFKNCFCSFFLDLNMGEMTWWYWLEDGKAIWRKRLRDHCNCSDIVYRVRPTIYGVKFSVEKLISTESLKRLKEALHIQEDGTWKVTPTVIYRPEFLTCRALALKTQ